MYHCGSNQGRQCLCDSNQGRQCLSMSEHSSAAMAKVQLSIQKKGGHISKGERRISRYSFTRSHRARATKQEKKKREQNQQATREEQRAIQREKGCDSWMFGSMQDYLVVLEWTLSVLCFPYLLCFVCCSWWCYCASCNVGWVIENIVHIYSVTVWSSFKPQPNPHSHGFPQPSSTHQNAHSPFSCRRPIPPNITNQPIPHGHQ